MSKFIFTSQELMCLFLAIRLYYRHKHRYQGYAQISEKEWHIDRSSLEKVELRHDYSEWEDKELGYRAEKAVCLILLGIHEELQYHRHKHAK